MASTAFWTVEYPVITITYTPSFSLSTVLRMSIPSISGSFISNRARSYVPLSIISSPSFPFMQMSTEWPLSKSASRHPSQMTRSSSIIRILPGCIWVAYTAVSFYNPNLTQNGDQTRYCKSPCTILFSASGSFEWPWDEFFGRASILKYILYIDLSRMLPGPYCSMILADHGVH